ncbi:alanine dehydrogenase [bacterium]|nr:alanine dehydrogenase [bacterium]
MIVGIPRERFIDETRVALAPSGVRELVERGAQVYVECDAGLEAGWTDAEYEAAGAVIAHADFEVHQRADLLLKVLPPVAEEVENMRDELMLISYLQLTLAQRSVFEELVEKEITAVGLENVEYEGGGHPVRRAMSEIAGALSVHVGARYLCADHGGRGVLLSGVPGVPPASVGIIGAGMVGKSAARAAYDMGAHVILVDQRIRPLREAMYHIGKDLHTGVINDHNLEKMSKFVDVLIAAVLIEDYPTPHLITREHVRSMKKGSVIVDVAIDQGGAVETSRPTRISDPTFVEEDVIHYCVPNMPAKVPRTATRAFQNQVLPFLRMIAEKGPTEGLRAHSYLKSGLNLFEGTVTRDAVARTFDCAWTPIEEVLR